MSFFDCCVETKLGKNSQLLKLAKLIDWQPILAILSKVHKKDERPGNGGFHYPKLNMFKAILLGQWHSLSDAKLEEALNVRLDFMKFCGFELHDAIPDHTSLNRFRNKLIQRKLEQQLFAEVNRQLEQLNLKVKHAEAAVIDATIIESAARPRRIVEISEDREEEQAEEENSTRCEIIESCDQEARWLKKGKRCYYGYKGFVNVDSGDGYINDIHVTPANVAEVNEFDKIIKTVSARGTRVMADKAYCSSKNKENLKARGLKNGIMYKAKPKQALNKYAKLFNRLVSRSRYIVERTIGTLKKHFGAGRASYYGIDKVKAQLYFKAICHNLVKAVNKIELVTG